MGDSSMQEPGKLIGTWERDGEVRDYYRVARPDELLFFYLVRDADEEVEAAALDEPALRDSVREVAASNAESGTTTGQDGRGT